MTKHTINLLNKLNHRFYQQNSSSFDQTRQLPWPGWHQVLSHFPQAKSPLSVLDIGCGNGRFYDYLKQNYMDRFLYQGVDFSPELINVARDKYSSNQVKFDRVDLLQASLPQLGHYDLIVLWGVLHHIPGVFPREQLFNWIQSQLNPTGLFAFSVWQFAQFDRFQQKIRPWNQMPEIDPTDLDENDYLLGWQKTASLRYCHYFDDHEIETLISQSRLKLISSYTADGKNHQLNKYYLVKHPA